MDWCGQSLDGRRMDARALPYLYRYCPRCRHEWPAKYKSCPECVRWLGDEPLERTEWQLVPAPNGFSASQRYELVGASALILRVVRDSPPDDEQSARIAQVIGEVLAVANGTACGVAEQGWLIWTGNGLRRAFRQGCEIEQRLITSLAQLENIIHHSGSLRWGIWIDQYVLAFDGQSRPAMRTVTGKAIFNFEPDNMLLSSEAIYQANRPWENFVGAPRRLLDGEEPFGYRMIGHKRPSALDHAEAKDLRPFIGRERQLSKIEDCWRRAGPTVKLAITAPAGSGKTRLIKEWLRRHSDVTALIANFSLFGGAVDEFASQLAELPPDRLDCDALIDAVVGRVHRDKIEALILDDLHWAGPNGLAFVYRLLTKLPSTGMLIILVSRPNGRQWLDLLLPTRELRVSPLPRPAAEELARRLAESPAVAAAAALRSKGNPLFVEQFAAWAAEARFHGGQSGPHTLHQVIAARISRLLKDRTADIRQRLRWGGYWERQAVDNELGELEAEVGLWLDRLETGDYADRLEAARHLGRLERLDYEIFLTSMLLGRPRPRSSRLREAIERLLIGSADQLLAELKQRTAKANTATKENVSREARRAADVLYGAFNWALARDFYQLAYSSALWDRAEISKRLAQCQRHSRDAVQGDSEVYAASQRPSLDEKPNVELLDLPYVWADLGLRYPRSIYFSRASDAAEAVNDHALAAWARRKALQSAETTHTGS